MKLFLHKATLLVVLISFCACAAQEIHISNKYEKGYFKKGNKVSFWEYYDNKGNLDLKINYDNGKILYLKPDTSEFVIKKNGEWVSEKLTVYPKYIGNDFFFYKDVGSSDYLDYSDEAKKNFTEGYVYILFEIDSTGAPGNFKIEKDIGYGCGQAALKAIEESAGRWIPGQRDGKSYSSKFLMPIQFVLNPTKNENIKPADPAELPLAKELSTVVLTGYLP